MQILSKPTSVGGQPRVPGLPTRNHRFACIRSPALSPSSSAHHASFNTYNTVDPVAKAPVLGRPTRTTFRNVTPPRTRTVVYAQPNNGSNAQPAGNAPKENIGLKRSIWTFIDVVSILGSVAGACAALMGLSWAMPYALALPLVLPVVSLVSALQREGLIAEVSHHQLCMDAAMHLHGFCSAWNGHGPVSHVSHVAPGMQQQ